MASGSLFTRWPSVAVTALLGAALILAPAGSAPAHGKPRCKAGSEQANCKLPVGVNATLKRQ